MSDHVARVIAQWDATGLDVDASPMAVVARIARIQTHLARELTSNFARFGLAMGDFDVLATLRRSGAPYALRPSDLSKSSMLTSGTMTSRLDRMEKKGLVRRASDPDDRRALMVHLTEDGLALVNEVAAKHFELEAELLSVLSTDDRKQLEGILGRWSAALEDEEKL